MFGYVLQASDLFPIAGWPSSWMISWFPLTRLDRTTAAIDTQRCPFVAEARGLHT